MSDPHPPAGDPFAMLLDPAAVLEKINGSAALRALDRRVCKPLDLRAGQAVAEVDEADDLSDIVYEDAPDAAALKLQESPRRVNRARVTRGWVRAS